MGANLERMSSVDDIPHVDGLTWKGSWVLEDEVSFSSGQHTEIIASREGGGASSEQSPYLQPIAGAARPEMEVVDKTAPDSSGRVSMKRVCQRNHVAAIIVPLGKGTSFFKVADQHRHDFAKTNIDILYPHIKGMPEIRSDAG